MNRHSLNDDVIIRERNTVTMALPNFLGSYKRFKNIEGCHELSAVCMKTMDEACWPINYAYGITTKDNEDRSVMTVIVGGSLKRSREDMRCFQILYGHIEHL